jgi:hypothetical protein
MFFEKFDEIVSDPKAWVYKGEELEYAADILAEFEKLHVRPSRKYFEYNDHKKERKSILLMITVLVAQPSRMPPQLMVIIHDYWLDYNTKSDKPDFFTLGVEKMLLFILNQTQIKKSLEIKAWLQVYRY